MARKQNQGSSWIAKSTRFAIYHRDNFQCVYCGNKVKIGTAHLDHVQAQEKGGSSRYWNLVTCCATCNGMKGQKSVRSFKRYLSSIGVEAEFTTGTIKAQLEKALDRKEGRRLETLRKIIVASCKEKA